jgi:23S rRNA (adenine-N6)-dimethyltransferase
MPRSLHGGRHELGQNFLNHKSTITRIADLVAATNGSILELGAGDGALTRALARLGRPLTAIEIDEHRAGRLKRSLPGVQIEQSDALQYPLSAGVIVGNIPFHLTTPILRRLLDTNTWQQAILLTQWEVARKRAGVGGRTMLTAQSAPWYEFGLRGRIPAHHFGPMPSVDGGLLRISRRVQPLLPERERTGYERFVRGVFTGRGGSFARIVQQAARRNERAVRSAMSASGIHPRCLPRDLDPAQWASLWSRLQG